MGGVSGSLDDVKSGVISEEAYFGLDSATQVIDTDQEEGWS